MQFTFSVAPSKLTVLPRFLLPPERASLSLCGRCAAYLVEFSFSTLHSFVECPGPCNKHSFPLVGQLLGWPAFSFLHLPARPVSGLVGEADSHTFRFLPLLARLASVLIGVLEVILILS